MYFIFIDELRCFSGISLDDIDSVENLTKDRILTTQEEYQETLVFNNAVREIFLNRFVQLFSGYDHFVIHPSQVNMKERFCSPVSMEN